MKKKMLMWGQAKGFEFSGNGSISTVSAGFLRLMGSMVIFEFVLVDLMRTMIVWSCREMKVVGG